MRIIYIFIYARAINDIRNIFLYIFINFYYADPMKKLNENASMIKPYFEKLRKRTINLNKENNRIRPAKPGARNGLLTLNDP